jgi:hypothetical protein
MRRAQVLHTHRITYLHTDQGGEFQSAVLRIAKEESGIEVEIVPARFHGSNGLIERVNRTIHEKVRALLIAACLPDSFWSEVALHAVHLYNPTPHSALRSADGSNASFVPTTVRTVQVYVQYKSTLSSQYFFQYPSCHHCYTMTPLLCAAPSMDVNFQLLLEREAKDRRNVLRDLETVMINLTVEVFADKFNPHVLLTFKNLKEVDTAVKELWHIRRFQKKGLPVTVNPPP